MTKKTRAPAGTRALPVTSDIGGALSDGMGEAEGLRDEIGEWKDNLESNGMEALPKYEELTECFDTLDGGMEVLDSLALPDCLSGLEVRYTRDTRQSAGSRAGRMSNALSALGAALDGATSWMDENPELDLTDSDDLADTPEGEVVSQDMVEERDAAREEVSTFAEELEDAIGQLEDASFPGMY